jgi:uncharacterized 2Fe-2S/4Fe-4S cluster protein (DUF4445 family)
MKQHTVRLQPLGKEIRVNDRTPLIDILHEYGIEFPCGGNGICGNCRVKLLSGDIELTDHHRDKLSRFRLSPEWRLACFSRCTGDITLELEQLNHFILADESEFAFNPRKGYGIAIDLGTTSLVAQLVNLETGKVSAAESMLNPQLRFGADLISRIQSCLDGKADEMRTLIRSATGKMVLNLIKNRDVALQNVVIVGNTAMMMIFCGMDVTPLSAYPFTVPGSQMRIFDPNELDWKISFPGKVKFYPHIGSFIGSDILAGIAATGLYEKEKFTALIDLGTNGEIALGNRNGILCASTAAGPAFEGSNISSGMRAVTGAISSVEQIDGQISVSVIGNTVPRGICGSGLIDAIAVLRKAEKIGMFGELPEGEEKMIISDGIGITAKDINEFQLAKAAIAAGMDILAGKLGISLSDVDEVYIAGAFGNYINLENVTYTGMIGISPEKIRKMGNTALIGAKMFLFDDGSLSAGILSLTRHISLESDPAFQEIFIEKMYL